MKERVRERERDRDTAMKKSEGCEGNSFQRYERKKFVKKEIIGGA